MLQVAVELVMRKILERSVCRYFGPERCQAEPLQVQTMRIEMHCGEQVNVADSVGPLLDRHISCLKVTQHLVIVVWVKFGCPVQVNRALGPPRDPREPPDFVESKLDLELKRAATSEVLQPPGCLDLRVSNA